MKVNMSEGIKQGINVVPIGTSQQSQKALQVDSVFRRRRQRGEYGQKYSQLGEWGSSMQLLLAAKLYSKNFVLFQPNNTPRFVPFLVDKNMETGAMESPVGWVRYQANHFDVAKFKMKENV